MYILIYTIYKDDLEYRKSFLIMDDLKEFLKNYKFEIKDYIVCKQLCFGRRY